MKITSYWTKKKLPRFCQRIIANQKFWVDKEIYIFERFNKHEHAFQTNQMFAFKDEQTNKFRPSKTYKYDNVNIYNIFNMQCELKFLDLSFLVNLVKSDQDFSQDQNGTN